MLARVAQCGVKLVGCRRWESVVCLLFSCSPFFVAEGLAAGFVAGRVDP